MQCCVIILGYKETTFTKETELVRTVYGKSGNGERNCSQFRNVDETLSDFKFHIFFQAKQQLWKNFYSV